MRPELYSIVLQCDGYPKEVASCHYKAIVHIKHKIITAHGESIAETINTLQKTLGGTGQGSAGVGVSWHYHMEPLLDALTQYSLGFQFTDVTKLIHFYSTLSVILMKILLCATYQMIHLLRYSYKQQQMCYNHGSAFSATLVATSPYPSVYSPSYLGDYQKT